MDKCFKFEVNPSRNFEDRVKNILLHENFEKLKGGIIHEILDLELCTLCHMM